MASAATTSPFMRQEQDVSPWLLWTSKEPLTQLIHEKQTDRRFVSEANEAPTTEDPPVYLPVHPIVPQANRYQAVLSRMDLASKKAAAFSAWST